jgi:hypothetical protein
MREAARPLLAAAAGTLVYAGLLLALRALSPAELAALRGVVSSFRRAAPARLARPGAVVRPEAEA